MRGSGAPSTSRLSMSGALIKSVAPVELQKTVSSAGIPGICDTLSSDSSDTPNPFSSDTLKIALPDKQTTGSTAMLSLINVMRGPGASRTSRLSVSETCVQTTSFNTSPPNTTGSGTLPAVASFCCRCKILRLSMSISFVSQAFWNFLVFFCRC